VGARLRSALGLSLLLAVGGCSDPAELRGAGPERPNEPQPRASAHEVGLERDQDPRVDPSRCGGDELDLLALIGSDLCTVPIALAQPLPGPEQLELRAPTRLQVAPGGHLEFELELVNRRPQPLDVDLRLRQFLPLGPENTVQLGDRRGDRARAVATDCTLRPMSTEAPPERITVPAHGELAIPAQWYANTRLVDPLSYVGSECPDFPPLPEGRYQSVFVVHGGAGSMIEVAVEIEVRVPTPKSKSKSGSGSASEAPVVRRDR
jgi:hypothetical protein